MEIYLYCSYEQSQKGFTLTKIEGDRLVPCPQAPDIVGDFFYYDRYQVLWRELPSEHQPSKREIAVSGGFFGIRGLKGRIQGDRWGSANIAFWARDPMDLVALRRISMGILGDVDGFTVLLLRQLSIGGEAGYQLDVASLLSRLESFTQSSLIRLQVNSDHPVMGVLPNLQRIEAARTSTELVRLAVCSSDWEGLTAKSKSGFWHRRQYNPLLTPEEFQAVFTGHGPIWELHKADKEK